MKRTNRHLLKRAVFEKADGNWIVVLPTITKQFIIRVQISNELPPIKASLKKKEGFVYKNLLDKRKEIKPKYQVNDLVRTANSKKSFSKGEKTNWSYKLYNTTELINDTKPSYEIDQFPERYDESLVKKTNLTIKESKDVLKIFQLKLYRKDVAHHCLC